MNYQVQVIDGLNRKKYLSYHSYSSALNALNTFKATEETEHTPEMYLSCAYYCSENRFTNEYDLINDEPVKIEHILYDGRRALGYE